MLDKKLCSILEKAENREHLSREELVYILGVPVASEESAFIRAVGDSIMRKKTDNGAIITGQIGIDIHPCEAACEFCSFCEGHTQMPEFKLDEEDVIKSIKEFTAQGDLYGMYLMTMAKFDKDNLLKVAEAAVKVADAKKTQIWVNVGDEDRRFFEELKAVGVTAAYHVCRIGEGKSTKIEPRKRIKTLENIKEAGLDLMSCCEPIGPEHSVEEIAENIDICDKMNVNLYGAMRRVAVPGTPLFSKGQISNLEMAHYVACTALAYAHVNNAKFFGIHEPCESGYLAGANLITAETGANPRDTVLDTRQGRGWDMYRCRKTLFECGFSKLYRGDESSIKLDYDYLKKTDSLF